MMRSWFI